MAWYDNIGLWGTKSGADKWFGGGDWKNPADAAEGPLNKIPGEMEKWYNPYIQAGQRALPGMEDQYNQLMNNPGGRLNQIGQGYQESPGFQFALQNALKAAGNASAAGGMAGSPQHQQQSMGIASGMASQDYNNWLQNAMGMYGMGLRGNEGLYNKGFEGSDRMAQQIAQALAAQSMLRYQGQDAQNKHSGGMWGNLFGGAGALGGGMFGGPMGAMMGGQMGNSFGRGMGG
jgi:hypothetical protein